MKGTYFISKLQKAVKVAIPFTKLMTSCRATQEEPFDILTAMSQALKAFICNIVQLKS